MNFFIKKVFSGASSWFIWIFRGQQQQQQLEAHLDDSVQTGSTESSLSENPDDGDDDDVLVVNITVTSPSRKAGQMLVAPRSGPMEAVGALPPLGNRGAFSPRCGIRKSQCCAINVKLVRKKDPSASTHDAPHPQMQCAICMDSYFGREPTATRCGHIFCKICLDRSLQRVPNCPICRAEISSHELSRLHL